MIVDLVRNDLGRVCECGLGRRCPRCARSSTTPACTTSCRPCGAGCGPASAGPTLLDATFPPGSVTGAPKLAALDVIAKLEPASPRARTAAPSAGSTPTAARATSTSPSARSGSTDGAAALRHRRRHHVGLDPRRRVGGDRAEGPPPAVGGVGVDERDAWSGSTATLVDADEAARVAVRPRAAHRRRRVRDAAGLRRARRSPCAATSSGWRRSAAGLRPRRARPRRAARGRRRGRRGQRPGRRARLRITVTGGPCAARLGPGRRRPDGDRGRRRRSPPWPPTADVVVVPVAPQRARRAGRAEDDVLRRERGRPGLRPRARARARRCSPTRPATCARAPAPTCSSSSTAGSSRRRCRPAAWPASPAPSSLELTDAVEERRPARRAGRRRRGVPHLDHPRGAAHRAPSTAASLPAVPRPAHRRRPPTPSPPSSPATSTPRRARSHVRRRRRRRPSTTSPAAVGGADVDDEVAVVGRRRRRVPVERLVAASSTRTSRPRVAQRAAVLAAATASQSP